MLMFTKMFYEEVIPYETDTCIALSEAFRNSVDSTENMRVYLAKFREMMDLLREHSRVPLRKQPQFVWNGMDSACWMFEEHRIMHALRDMLVSDAVTLFGQDRHSEANPLLVEAVDMVKTMVAKNETWEKTPFVAAIPEVQPLYLLALAFRTQSMRLENASYMKTSATFAQRAYQLSELADVCWKAHADPDHTRQLLTAWHHCCATEAADSDFQTQLSHITCARELSKSPVVQSDYEQICEKNTTVYFLTPEPITCPVYSISEGLARL